VYPQLNPPFYLFYLWAADRGFLNWIGFKIFESVVAGMLGTEDATPLASWVIDLESG
jgi:hypothetical protein